VALRTFARSWCWQLAGVVLLSCSWGVKGANTLLLGQYREALQTHRKPPFLNGLQLTVPDGVLKPLVFRKPVDSRPGRRYLLLLSSDTCAASLGQERAWGELLARMPFADGDTVVLLSTSGGQISSRLARVAATRGVEHRTGLVTDVARFSQATGLSWTPEIAGLDEDLRVRVASPSATPVFVKQILEFFQDRNSFGATGHKKGAG